MTEWHFAVEGNVCVFCHRKFSRWGYRWHWLRVILPTYHSIGWSWASIFLYLVLVHRKS